MENKSARAKVRALGFLTAMVIPNIGALCTGLYNCVIYSHRLAAE